MYRYVDEYAWACASIGVYLSRHVWTACTNICRYVWVCTCVCMCIRVQMCVCVYVWCVSVWASDTCGCDFQVLAMQGEERR